MYSSKKTSRKFSSFFRTERQHVNKIAAGGSIDQVFWIVASFYITFLHIPSTTVIPWEIYFVKLFFLFENINWCKNFYCVVAFLSNILIFQNYRVCVICCVCGFLTRKNTLLVKWESYSNVLLLWFALPFYYTFTSYDDASFHRQSYVHCVY